MTSLSILFVDDEPRVLEGLQNLLRKQRKEWSMTFAPGAAAALSELEKRSFDVVVSDMRMPQMDGAALLGEVQKRCPAAVRIVLSGQTDQEMARRTVSVAHQFLAKPCDGETLRRTIQRTLELKALLSDPGLRAQVGQIGQLPALPSVYHELSQRLEDPNVRLAELAAVVQQDPSLTAKVLQLVNSAFFGLGRKTSTILEALMHLGLEALRGLVLLMHTASELELDPSEHLMLQRHAVLTARMASRIATPPVEPREAFTAGMLADIGRLILVGRMYDASKEALARSLATGRPLHELERELLGFDHAHLGAYLLGLWNLPYSVVEAVAYHHAPATVACGALDLTTVVHVADALVDGDGLRAGRGALDLAHLERLGLSSRVERWRTEAEQELLRQDGGG